MTRKLIPSDLIAERIFIVRGQKVILDSDLAALYEVPTKRFNEAVRRNSAKFPADFSFQLSDQEWRALRSQFATLKPEPGRGQHRKYLPYVFTEHGAIMAASLLNSTRAIEVSVFVVRAFVQQRELLASSRDLARQLKALEQRLEKKISSHDQAIAGIIDTLRELMAPTVTPKRRIGFVIDDETGKKS
ncbi:MAG: ORF6N domain-containing protein [Betaproteobacteria bacterium]|nr:ORF6N domain-containing protein [Betaproteobacteria bacterium]